MLSPLGYITSSLHLIEFVCEDMESCELRTTDNVQGLQVVVVCLMEVMELRRFGKHKRPPPPHASMDSYLIPTTAIIIINDEPSLS